MPDVRHEPAAHRFAAEVEGGVAELAYERRDDAVAFVHTFVPPASRGGGVGESLVEAGLAWARDEGVRVIPACPFVRAYVEEHPDAADGLLDG